LAIAADSFDNELNPMRGTNRSRQIRKFILEQLEERCQPAAFTPGNLVVERIGDGTTTLSSAAAAVSIVEYSTAGGSAQQTISLPTSGSNQVTDSGTATSNGYLNSYGAYLAVPGYNSAAGTAIVASLNFKVGTAIGVDGNVASRTLFPTGGATGTPPSPFSGNNFRSMIATGSNTFYATGTSSGTPNTGGAWYYNGSAFTQISDTTTGQPTNLRNVEIYNNQLYVSSGSGSFLGISSIGTGLPTTGSQTATLRINTGGSPYGFVMFDTNNDSTLDLAYIADDRTAVGGGLQKWTFNGTSWSNSWALLVNGSNSLSSTAGTGFAGLRGLAGSYSSGVATLYATTTETTNNRVIQIVDSGTTPTTATAVATAGANYVFRGLDFAPDAPPVINSITRVSGATNPTNASSAQFTVTFSEAVSGVDANDFAMDFAGITGASVTAVTGSGTTYTVTVSTGSGDGTVSIDLAASPTVADLAGNALTTAFTNGEAYTLDRTAPVVNSIARVSGATNPTNASSAQFTVTFSEAVSGVDANDFAMDVAGITGASVTAVTGSGTTYTVTVSTGSGDGTVSIDLAASPTVSDLAGNALTTAFTAGEAYTVDRSIPVVNSITRVSGAANPTNASSAQFTVTFSEAVSGVDASDFAMDVAGITGASVTTVTGSGTTYTVTVSTGSGDGTVSIDLAASPTVADLAGNTLTTAFTAGEAYTVDRSIPVVNSIARVSGAANPTNASSVLFTVTFSEAVSGVDANDFAMDVAGITGASVTTVTGSGTTYTVTVSTGSGDGTVSIDLAASPSIQDSIGNSLVAPFTNGEAYILDRTAPVVNSITRVSGATNPTNASSAQFTVTFSEAVSGVDASDFAMDVAGITGASVTTVTGSGATYTVTVSTGSGDGTVSIDLAASPTVADLAGNTLTTAFTNGEAYTLDRTAPVVNSITRVSGAANPTNASSVLFTVTFSEAVSGVDANDFAMDVAGITGASVTTVTGSGTTYTVTVSNGSGDGTVSIDLAASPTVSDLAGNTLTTAFTAGEAYTIDRSIPVVNSITRVSGTANPTNATTAQFTVTFSEAVSGVDANDFAMDVAGITGATINSVSGSGATYTVTVSTGSGDGTVSIDLAASPSIQDLIGNSLVAPFTNGEAYTLDRTTPVVNSITRANPVGQATNASSAQFTVTFSEAVSGVDANDFAMDVAGITGATINSVSGSGATYTVTVSTGSGDGTVSIDLAASPTVSDLAGNALTTAFTNGEAYTLDRTAPVVNSITRVSGATNPTNASSAQFTVTFSEAVSGVDASDFAMDVAGITGASVTAVTGSGTTYTVTVSTGSGDGTVSIDLAAIPTVADLAGNALTTAFTNGEAYTLDRTAPVVNSITRVSGAANPTNASSAQFTVIFSEAVSGVDANDFAMDVAGITGASVTTVTGSGTTYTVTVSTGSGDGTVSIDLAASPSVADPASNTLTTAFTAGEAYTVDRSIPVVNSITRVSGAANPTNASSAQFTVTFSEAVSGVDASDFAMDVAGITGATINSVSGSGTTYTVTVSTGSGDGTVSIDLAASPTVSDLAGNALTTAFTAGEAYTVDRSIPVVNSITRANPAGQATNATGLVWRVMLSEAIDASSLTVSDFMLTVLNGSISGVIASVTPASGLGNMGFDISVSGVVGNAEVRLVLSGPFSDLAGNIQTAGFASGESYLVDQKAPVILSIDRQLPTDAFTNQSSVTYRINFDEPVDPATFSIADLAPSLASGLTGGVITSLTAVAGSGDSSFDVGITNITGAGILRLDFTGSVADRQGNVRSQGFTGGQTYVIDRSPPAVVSITRIGAAATPMSSVNFVVTFNEPIDAATLNPSDFAITRTGTASGTIGLIAPVTGNPSAFTITLTGLTGSGSIRPDIVQGASISDLAGNTYQGPFTLGDSVTLTPVMARISPASALEGSAINFVVSINQVLDINLSITVSPVAIAGGAQNGIDFDGSQRVVDIQAGQLSTIVAIPTISEDLVELDEVFDVVISNMNATGRNTGIDQGTARGTIVNDDSSVVAINPAAALEGSNLAFTASLTNPVDFNVSMRISVEGSFSDTANRDDIPASQSGILTIAAGQVTGTFQMMTIQDEIVERDETVTVSARDLATGGRAVSLAMPLATGTILNDDFARLTMVSGSALEGSLIPIRLVIDRKVDTDVRLLLTPGIAQGDTASLSDFANIAVPAVISAGSLTATAFISSIPDHVVERDEYFTVTGSQTNASGRSVALVGSVARATILNDDNAVIHIAATGAVRGQSAVFSTTLKPGAATVVGARVERPFPGFNGNISIAQGDVNGDGNPDVIYGAGAGLAGGQVRIFDGANGFLMTTISAFPGSARGVVVAAGDVDGNGVKDLIVAGQGTAGLVRAYDARSRALLRSFTAFPGYSGMVAISAGDINGDRVDDIAVSVANGRLRVLNGRNGSVLRNITAFNSGAMANSIALADLNGDGLKEIVVGAAAGSAIMVYPPMSGGPAAFNAFAPTFRGGVRLVALDINGDGIDEIVATTGPGTRGLVRVFDNAYRVTDEFFSTHFGTLEGSFIG
jgi:hypothetical protein